MDERSEEDPVREMRSRTKSVYFHSDSLSKSLTIFQNSETHLPGPDAKVRLTDFALGWQMLGATFRWRRAARWEQFCRTAAGTAGLQRAHRARAAELRLASERNVRVRRNSKSESAGP